MVGDRLAKVLPEEDSAFLSSPHAYRILMNPWNPPQPVNLADLSFMDARFKLIEIAAFLDRVQRAGQDGDFRVLALKKAITRLGGEKPERAREVLLSFSDPSEEPIAKATMQGAMGAWKSE